MQKFTDLCEPDNEVDISYSYMEVDIEKKVKDLVNGHAVTVDYVDAADDE